MKTSRKCVVIGRVQGVFFRQATSDKAKELSLTGWVRNLPTGEVECLISGENESIDAMIDWLHDGPAAAKVESIQINACAPEEHTDFKIVR